MFNKIITLWKRKMLQLNQKKYLIPLFFFIFLLNGCATTSNNSYSSRGFTNQEQERATPPINMEVIIPVFDGGIEKDETGKVVDEIKRAEAIYFATKIKRHMEDRKFFINPKVMPSSRAAGDIYLYGNIIKSNGYMLELKITAEDSRGKKLYTKNYKSVCDEKCSSNITGNIRFNTNDRFEYSIYRKIAIDLEKNIIKKSKRDLERIRTTTELRFARDIAPDKFNHYLKTSKSNRSISKQRHNLVSTPDNLDPMYLRIKAVRVKEQMFIDDSQVYINGFVNDGRFLTPYKKWQDKSSKAVIAKRKADSARTKANIGAILGVAIAIAGASEGNSDLAIGGGVLADQSFKAATRFKEEAVMWESELNELNIDINKQVAPRNIEIENTVYELRGSISEQFDAYRTYLKTIYLEENKPLNNSYEFSIN